MLLGGCDKTTSGLLMGAISMGIPALFCPAAPMLNDRYRGQQLDAGTRPADLPPPEPGLRWLGLDVKRHVPIDDDHATVEFVARSKLGGRAHRLHERSRFVREGGRWFYVDGDLG